MSTCDVIVIDTKKINRDMLYYDGISALVKAMRKNNPNASGMSLVSQSRGKLCVLLIDGKPVSMLRVFKEKNSFDDGNVEYINLVITLPEERRKGYSRLLFLWLFEHHKSRLDFALEVESAKDVLVDFYKSLGFVKIGETNYPLLIA